MRGVIDKYWEEWTLALRDADPTRPQLIAVLTGDAAKRVADDLAKNRALDEIATRPSPGPVPHRTNSVAINDQNAIVDECVKDDTVLTLRTDGQVLNSKIEILHLEKQLVRLNGSWKISYSSKVEDGARTCADI